MWMYLVLFLLLTIVSNLIYTLIYSYLFKEKLTFEWDKVGAAIGSFERIVMFIMLVAKEPLLLTVVLAVKSFARYGNLIPTDESVNSDYDKDFGKKYIIGTLYSILVVFLVYMFVIEKGLI